MDVLEQRKILKEMMEHRSAENLKKVARVFQIPYSRKKKEELICALLSSPIPNEEIKKEVENCPVLKRFQKLAPKSEEKGTTKKVSLVESGEISESSFRATVKNVGKIKNIFEILSRFEKEMSLVLTPRGILVNEMDTEHVALVKLKIPAEKFLHFKCPKKQCFGVDVSKIADQLKKAKRKDSLTMRVLERKFIFDLSSSDGVQWNFAITTLNLNRETLSFPEDEWVGIVTIPSKEFFDIATMIHKKEEYVDFILGSTNDSINIVSECDQETIFSIKNDETHKIEISRECFKSTRLDSKYLFTFSRSYMLAKNVKIIFKRNFPTIFEFGERGGTRIKYLLAPAIPNK